MIDVSKILYFYEVAKEASLTQAALKIGTHQSNVSRNISSLEASLGKKLFIRNKDGISLTADGRNLFAFAEKIAQDMELLQKYLNDDADEPFGELRIQTTPLVGSEWLAPLMRKFLDQYPKLRLVLNHAFPEISLTHNDAILRTYMPGNPHLIQIPVLSGSYKIYGSKEYFESHGFPLTAADLDNHKIITYFGEKNSDLGNSNWLLLAGKKTKSLPRTSAIVANSFHSIHQLVKSGCGIAALPYFLNTEEAGLVEILMDLEPPKVDFYLIYEKERQSNRNLSALANYLSSVANFSG